ncbi:unnamed protein product [Somion occarium]|uniref:Uncharacterized protein n=1 Tax=Somion occarium TaxID=3059160 RepID=A0ABP1DIU5_9APHY
MSTSNSSVQLIHVLPRLPNATESPLIKRLQASFTGKIASNHPNAKIQHRKLHFGGTFNATYERWQNTEALLNMCLHLTVWSAHLAVFEHKPASVATYAVFWLCEEASLEGAIEPGRPNYPIAPPWEDLAEDSTARKINMTIYVVTTEGREVPPEVLRRCSPIPLETILSLPLLPSYEFEAGPSTQAGVQVLNLHDTKLLSYEFGPLGSSKYQIAFGLWEPFIGDDLVVRSDLACGPE